MRNKKMNKKLDLNKVTIANLEMKNIRGGELTLPVTLCDTIDTHTDSDIPKCWSDNPIYCGSESC